MNIDRETLEAALVEFIETEVAGRVVVALSAYQEHKRACSVTISLKIKADKEAPNTVQLLATAKTKMPTGPRTDETSTGFEEILQVYSMQEEQGQERLEGT